MVPSVLKQRGKKKDGPEHYSLHPPSMVGKKGLKGGVEGGRTQWGSFRLDWKRGGQKDFGQDRWNTRTAKKGGEKKIRKLSEGVFTR